MDSIDARLYLNLIRGGAARLSAHRQTINDLNVFPIPDGDTGDNMFMTIQAGCTPASLGADCTLSEMAKAVSAGMLMGARGNSGVILSRIFAGIAKGLADVREAGVNAFSRAMQAGVDESYHAVSEPVEGTILTVFREGVEAAAGSKDLDEYFDLLVSAMDLSLQHTPELLDVLKKAGVVDSGGAGLLYIAEGMRAALHGEIAETLDEAVPAPAHADLDAFTEDSILEFGYCTEFLLRLQRSKVDLDTFDETVISDWLAQNGDSLVFFRDGTIIKVHVHTRTPGEILNHCQQYGEFLTLKVENMTLQHHENHMDERFKVGRKSYGVVAVASGSGLAATFKELGADIVIEGGQTMNPPVERFIEAFDTVNAETVFVLPNNGNILLTARQAAEIYGKADIRVIPSKTLGEGYYALANLDTEAGDAQTIEASLTEAVDEVATGLVSRAIRDSGGFHEGDYLGIHGKMILTSGPDPESTLLALADTLQAGSFDVILVFAGADAKDPDGVRKALAARYPRSEVILQPGGQPVYEYILVLF
ncbi:MAG: DAK2 domain-containing protein [Bacteroidales bacterium]|nr:DAK2 domain-containing protein [Bacteroidales bacterium]